MTQEIATRQSPAQVIEGTLKSKEVVSKVVLALGGDSNDEAAKQEAFKYIASVLQEVQRTIGDDKKDLTTCEPHSIVQCMIDAATMQLPIDGRSLAHLMKYGKKATLQIGYRGFLYKISQYYQDASFAAVPVFEGDDVSISDENGFQSYKHKPANPFEDNPENMRGIVCGLTFTHNGQKHSKVIAMSMDEIGKVRSKAKQDYIWKEWFIEKAKVAGLKRLCKIHFAGLMGLQDMIEYDNRENFMIDATPPDNQLVTDEQAESLKIALMTATEEAREKFMVEHGSYASVKRSQYTKELAKLQAAKAGFVEEIIGDAPVKDLRV